MTTTPILRVSEPRDLLSVVPFQLGFTPSDSLVLISLRGPRRRVGLVLRVDLPASEHAPQVARQVGAHLRHDGAIGAVVVIYSGHEDPLGPSGAGLVDLVGYVDDALQIDGIGLVDAFHVGPQRYRSLTCGAPCCPAEGFAVDDLLSTVVSAEMVVRGAAPVPNRQSLVGDIAPRDPGRLAEVERVAASLGDDRRTWARDAIRLWRAELSRYESGLGRADVPADVDAETAGRVLGAMADLRFRDAVMLTCVPGSAVEPEKFVVAARTTDGAERLFASVFDDACPMRPDPALAAAAQEALRSLVRQSTGAAAAPPLALLGWLAWWSGDGATANDYVDLALCADRDYKFALLLGESLEHGVAPGWARRDRIEDAAGRTRP